MQFDAGAFLSGFLGVLMGGGVVAVWLKAVLGRMRDLERDLSELRDRRFAALERRVDAVEHGCIGPRVAESLRNLEGWTKTIDVKLDRIAEEAAATKARLDADRKWLENLDRAHAEHVRDREVHCHG